MHGENNGGCITRKDKSISLIPYSPRLGGTSKGTCRSSIVREDLSHRWAEKRKGKGGGATVSICASLDSAATARGREGLPRCGFHNKMINDVFVLSYKRCFIRFFLSRHALKFIHMMLKNAKAVE